jgi:hypothetical protein
MVAVTTGALVTRNEEMGLRTVTMNIYDDDGVVMMMRMMMIVATPSAVGLQWFFAKKTKQKLPLRITSSSWPHVSRPSVVVVVAVVVAFSRFPAFLAVCSSSSSSSSSSLMRLGLLLLALLQLHQPNDLLHIVQRVPCVRYAAYEL